jgi:CxxC-x17-CxxC domain-containing protein
MGNFNREGSSGRRSFGGRPSEGRRSQSFGGDRRGGGRDRRPVELHDATCDKCGAECQLPFRPSGSKPVYCRDCFGKQDSSESRGPSSAGPSTELLEMINAKLDKILEALELNDEEEQ